MAFVFGSHSNDRLTGGMADSVGQEIRSCGRLVGVWCPHISDVTSAVTFPRR